MNLSTFYVRARRGGVLISALAFVVIASALVVGMITMSVSFYARAKTEADYEAALPLAEAGVRRGRNDAHNSAVEFQPVFGE